MPQRLHAMHAARPTAILPNRSPLPAVRPSVNQHATHWRQDRLNKLPRRKAAAAPARLQ